MLGISKESWIRDIKGDRIQVTDLLGAELQVYDGTSERCCKVDEVADILLNRDVFLVISFSDGSVITLTPETPILLADGTAEKCGSIQIGRKVFNANGNPIRYTSFSVCKQMDSFLVKVKASNEVACNSNLLYIPMYNGVMVGCAILNE